jgi:3-hydroxyisobutyrate dehydrogenase
MGAPMARNLADAGHEVRVWNRTRDKAEKLDLPVLDSPTAEGADVVVTMVADGDALESIIEGVEFSSGQTWWQASTIGLAATERLAPRAGDAAFVDAPVLGTRQPAEDGKLTVLASGRGREALTPLFDAVAVKVVDLGDEIGDGSRLKLVLNSWVVGVTEAVAESVALAEGLGLDPQLFLDAIEGGPLGLPYAKLKGGAMIKGDFTPSFPLSLAAKDAGLVDEAARAAGLRLPLAPAIREQMQRAIDAGHGDDDMAATIWAARSS